MVSITVNGAKRVTVGSERLLLIDLTIGTSHQQIPFNEAQLLGVGDTAAMIKYIATQALQSVSAATTITTVPAGFPDIRATTAVTGSLPMAGFGITQRTVTADTAATTSDYAIWCDTTGGAIAVTLPTAVGVGGTRYEIKNLTAAHSVTITPAGSEKIDGASTAVLSLKGQTAVLTSDGVGWQRTPNVAAQTNGAAADLAAMADVPTKAFVTALSTGLVAEGIFIAPA